MPENIQGTETAVAVPQELTWLKLITSNLDNSGLVFLLYPFNEKLSARAVSPTTKTINLGFAVFDVGMA